jgi:NADH-quinone oxidoreductase subunit E
MGDGQATEILEKVQFSPEAQQEVDRILAAYPDRYSTTLPLLHLAQREFGYISPAVEQLVADILDRPVTEIHGVVTFYTMYNEQPVGKHHVQLCRNITCWIKNAPGLLEYLKEKLGIEVGETSADGLFTLSEVECLAHCEYAPVIQINDEIIGNITREKIDEIVADARK